MENTIKNFTDDIEILTPTGWQYFDGIKAYRHKKKAVWNGIESALEHRYIINNMEVFAKELDGVIIIDCDEYFYDPVNVSGGSVYCHDKKYVSHNTFAGGGNTLISSSILLALRSKLPDSIRGDLNVYQKPIKDHKYVMTVDTARGRGADYSAFSVVDITSVPFQQVATYRNNLVSPLTFPDVIYKIGKAYNDAYMIVESNDQGSMVYKTLYYEYEYEHMYSGKLQQGVSFGLDMSKKVKRLGCSNLKDIIEQGKLVVYDEDTIKELCCFEAKGSSYQASQGNHDDMVMTLVMFAWFLDSNIFGYLSDETLRGMMAAEKEKLILESVPFEGNLHGDENEANLILEIVDQQTNERKAAYAVDPDFGVVVVDSLNPAPLPLF